VIIIIKGTKALNHLKLELFFIFKIQRTFVRSH